jgi:hypothetical protein
MTSTRLVFLVILIFVVSLTDNAEAETYWRIPRPEFRLSEYLWDGSAVLVYEGREQKVMFLDEPGRLYDFPDIDQTGESRWSVRLFGEYNHEPFILRHLPVTNRLAAVRCGPDLQTEIVDSWGIGGLVDDLWGDWGASFGDYQIPREIRFHQGKNDPQTKAPFYVVSPDSWEGLGNSIGFNQRWQPYGVIPWPQFDNEEDVYRKPMVFHIKRMSDGRVFNFEWSDGNVDFFYWHPRLDYIAITLKPYRAMVKTSGSKYRMDMQISDWWMPRVIVLDLTGHKPVFHDRNLGAPGTVIWHPTKPWLLLNAGIEVTRKLPREDFGTFVKPMSPPFISPNDLAATAYTGHVLWDLETQRIRMLTNIGEEGPGWNYRTLLPLPGDRLLRTTPSELILEDVQPPDDSSEKEFLVRREEILLELEQRIDYTLAKERESRLRRY